MARHDSITTKGSRFTLLASVCIVVAALYFAQPVLVPIVLAMLISFLLAPITHQLERLKLGRVPSVLIVVLLMFALISGLGYVVWKQVDDLANNLDQYKGNIIAKVERFHFRSGIVQKLSNTAAEVEKKIQSPAEPATTQSSTTQGAAGVPTQTLAIVSAPVVADPLRDGKPPALAPSNGASVASPTTQQTNQAPVPVVVVDTKTSAVTALWNYVGLVLGPLGTAGIVIVLVIFILLQRDDLRDRMIRLAGEGQLNVTTQALNDASTRISRYLLAQSIVNGTYAVAISIGLWLISLTLGGGTIFPSLVLFGLLCGVLRFIPYLGPWIGAAFPIVMSLAVYPGMGVFVAVVVMFIVVELITNNFMEPWLYGSSTGLSTVAILVSAVFWTWLWGPIGLLVSTPLTVCIVVIGKYVPALQFLDVLLGDEPVLQPPVRVYQRLLALDEEEASELMEQYIKEMPLEKAYDEILAPALALAEIDVHRGRLDEERAVAIRRAVREIVEDLGDRERKAKTAQDAKRTVDEAKGVPPSEIAPTKAEERAEKKAAASRDSSNGKTKAPASAAGASGSRGSGSVDVRRVTVPEGCTVNILVLPAHDEADEICGLMLAQLLELRGYCAVNVSQSALASEMVDAVGKHESDIIVISALPPAAMVHARYLCKRIVAKHPDLDTIIGVWTVDVDPERAAERMACNESAKVVTTFQQALDQIHQLAAPLLLNQTPAPAKAVSSS